MEYILWVILSVIVGYLSLGFLFGCFSIYLLWGIGHFNESVKENRSSVIDLIKQVLTIMFIWGTIPFRKKIDPNV